MSAQSFLAKLGLRTATLGSLASLALAFPLAEGSMDPAAHTDATRIGVFAARGGTPEVGVVVSGTQSLSVRQTGVVVTGTINASSTVTSTGAVLTPVAANPGGATTIWVDSAGNILKFGANPMISVGGAGAVQFSNGSGVDGDAATFFWDNTLKALALGSNTPAARLDILGLDLSAAADGAVGAINVHSGGLSKNDTNTRQFYGTRLRPTFNTGASNANTTYDILNVDSVNGTTTGLTVNLVSLNYGGTNVFKVVSDGSTVITGVPYVWPTVQGAANSIMQNNGSGTLVWNAVSGDATLNGSGVLTLASTITAGGPTGSGTVVPVITYDAKGRLTAVTTAAITAAGIGAIGGSIAANQIAYGLGANTIQGSATFLNVAGQVTLGTATPDATASFTLVGPSLTTQATNSIGSAVIGSTLSKNDTNTRTFYDTLYKPTINAGGSNTNTTFNVLAVDTVNAGVTGVTTNLLNLAYGGTTVATITSVGSLTAQNIKTEPNGKVRLGNVDLGYSNQVNTVVIAVGNANQASDTGSIILGMNSVNSSVLMPNAILMGDSINATSSGSYHFYHFAMGQYINITNFDKTITLGFGAATAGASRLAPVGSNSINFGVNSSVPTLWIGAASGVGTFGQVGLGTVTADATARFTVRGTDLSTAVDQSVATIAAGSTLTKNDTNTRVFYGTQYKPTFNTGASNANTTYNVLAIDSVNTSVTGLTVNLLNLNYGGVNVGKIDSTGLATFNGGINSSGVVTLSRNGSGTGDYTLGVTGTTINNATSSQVRIGSAIASGNTATNGGTYLGINSAASGAGSAADLIHAQAAGVSAFRVLSNTTVRINSTVDDATGVAQLSVANVVTAASAACLFVDNGNDTGAASTAILVRSKGNTGASRVFCVRNLDHAAQFSFTIGSLGAMAWGSGDAARDVGLSRSTSVANALVVDGGGSPGNFLISGRLGVNTGSLSSTNAVISVTPYNITTDADSATSVMTFSGTVLSKNDANTRQFYGFRFLPTFNTGASNTGTTYNVINVDTVNTSITGLTVNLLSLSSGGTNVFLVDSTGVTTLPRDGAGAGNYTLGLTGRPNQSASSSLFRLGNGISGGNNATNGGTYIGISTPGSLGGSAADFINFQKNGTSVFNITVNGLTGIGSAASASTALLLPISTTTISSLRIPHGAAPTSPINGDIWTTSTAMFVQIGGSTVQLGSGTIGGSIAANQVAFGLGSNTIQGSANLTYDGTTLTSASQIVSTKAGAASVPAVTLTGAWFTGGSATTTKPQLLVEPTGATSTGWSTSGTGLGVNAASGFTGNLVDLQLNGVSKFNVASTGALTVVSTSVSIGTVSYVWPSSQGAASTVLTNDGAGNLSWVAGGGGGTPGGSTTQLQYNNAGAFGGIAGFTYTPAGSNTFDLNMSRTYTGLASGSNKYGTLNSTLSVTPTTTASGGTGYALRGALSIDDVTGLASTNGSLFAIEASITDASIVGGTWNGTIGAFRAVTDISTDNNTAGAFSAVGGAHNTTGINVAATKSYTGSATSYVGIVSTVQLTTTGTVTSAYGVRMGGITASSGAITTAYGVYIETVTGTGITTGYGLYQVDTGALNFFGGVVAVAGATPITSTALITPASTTARSSLRIPHGTAPTSPVNGDIWTDTTGLFVRVNNATVKMGTVGGTFSQNQITFGSATANQISGSSKLTWDDTSAMFHITASNFTASSGIARINGDFSGSAGNHYMSGLTITLDNAQTGGSNNSIDGVLTNISCTGNGTTNNTVNGFRTIVSLPTGQNTSQATLFTGSMTTSGGSTYTSVYGSNLSASIDGAVTNFIGYEIAAAINSTISTAVVGYSETTSTSGGVITIPTLRGFSSTATVSSGDIANDFMSFYAAPQLLGVSTNVYGAYLAPNVNGSGVATNLYGIYIAPQNTGAVTNMYGIYQAGANVNNQFEGPVISNLSPSASQNAVVLTGTWFTGGDDTTTKPLVLIEPSGTTSNNWSTAGTAFGINANVAFVGNLVDLKVNAASYFKVDNLGTAVISGLADLRVGDVSSSWTDSGSQVIQDNSWNIINTNSSTISTFTLDMMPNPIDGKITTIVTAGDVTTFTLNGNGHTVNNAPGALVANTSVSFIYFGGIWYRLY